MDLESLVRKAVIAETEPFTERVIASVLHALKSVNPRTSFNHHTETSQGIDYQLMFANKVPSTIFTDSKLQAEENGPIKIELVDTINKAVVTYGPLSSMKIQIVVLDGDLGFEDHENWTEEQFNAKVIEGKKDKRPLVIGDLDIVLKDGVGTLSDLSFTDNSSWIKCRKFRLSARVVTSIGGQVRIKEAISNAFKVKEYRAKMYEKHYPPSLDDDVWRLEKIAKDGIYHRRLADQHICKVKDFMQMYKNDPNKLKDILNCTDRLWNTIANHASTSVRHDEKPNAVDGHSCQPPAKRSCIQEPLVEIKNDQAYENMNTFYPVDGHAILGQSNDLTSMQAEPISTPTTAFSGTGMSSYHASTSSSYKGGLPDHIHQLQFPVETNSHPIQPSDPKCGDYNVRMDGLLATEEIVPRLAYGMTSQASMPNAVEGHNYQPPAKCSFIQKSLVESKKDHAYENFNTCDRFDGQAILFQSNGLTSLQVEPISTSTTAFSGIMHMGSYHASTSSSYTGGLEDHNQQLQLPVAQNTRLIQASDPMCCGDYNLRMDRLQATCNEQTVPNLAFDMTSQTSMSTCPPDTALYEHSNGFHLPSTSNDLISSVIQTPVNATFEDCFPSFVQSPFSPELDFLTSFPNSFRPYI